MNFREFLKYNLLKVLLVLVVIQLGVIAFIQNFNHKPRAISDKVEVTEGNTVTIAPLKNDVDKDDKDELSIHSYLQASNGTVLQKGNYLYYTPNKGFTGLDSFAYKVYDNRKESKEAYILIHVAKNQSPRAIPDIFYVYQQSKITINLLDNDTDPEGDSLFLNDYTNPAFGKLNMLDGNISYKAPSGVLVDSFYYTIGDGISLSEKGLVKINILSKNDSRYPWMFTDVGDAAIPGNLKIDNRIVTVKASGSDIWNNSDGFYFGFQHVEGNFTMITKVVSLDGNDQWTKAGLMARESLKGDSKHAFVCVTTQNGVVTHQREATGESTRNGNSLPDIKAPYWLKLARRGDDLIYQASADGKDWKEIDRRPLPIDNKVFVGFAVTSHNNGETAQAQFSDYRLAHN